MIFRLYVDKLEVPCLKLNHNHYYLSGKDSFLVSPFIPYWFLLSSWSPLWAFLDGFFKYRSSNDFLFCLGKGDWQHLSVFHFHFLCMKYKCIVCLFFLYLRFYLGMFVGFYSIFNTRIWFKLILYLTPKR